MKIWIKRSGIYIRYGMDKRCESWKILKIFGKPLEHKPHCGHEHDCCGCTFTMWLKVGLFRLYSIRADGINV